MSPIIQSVDVSIIISVFNKLTLTQNMLACLVKTLPQNLFVEVMILNDASTDETAAWLSGLRKTESLPIYQTLASL
jgi:glycosyltransferase involved in cell wall biosynthesis